MNQKAMTTNDDKKAIDAIRGQLWQPDFKAALKDVIPATAAKYLTPERIIRVVTQAASRSEMLLKCTPISLLRAVMALVELGLEPGGQLGQAYLVPFRNNSNGGAYEVTPIIGYRGYLELFRRSGERQAIIAHEICEHDDFDFQLGDNPQIHHKPTLDDRGETIGAYCIAQFTNEGVHREIMGKGDIEDIRARSPSQRKGLAGPWKTDYKMMARKTVIRRAARYWPLATEEMQRGVNLDNAVDSGEWEKSLAGASTQKDQMWLDSPNIPAAAALEGTDASFELPPHDENGEVLPAKEAAQVEKRETPQQRTLRMAKEYGLKEGEGE